MKLPVHPLVALRTLLAVKPGDEPARKTQADYDPGWGDSGPRP
jgi:hypothetical protein